MDMNITKYASAHIKHLFDEAMSNIKIYSVELRNIRRGRRPSWIFLARLNKS